MVIMPGTGLGIPVVALVHTHIHFHGHLSWDSSFPVFSLSELLYGVKGHLELHNKFKVSLGCMKPCLLEHRGLKFS